MGPEILAAFLPLIIDAVKTGIAKWRGTETPAATSAEEYAQIVDADIRRLEALAKLDAVGPTSQWVADIRALQRPAVVAAVGLTWVYGAALATMLPEKFLVVSQMAGAVFFYLFGERVSLYIQRARK